MRLLSALPALALLLGARVSDAHRHDGREPHFHDTRELLDICANINVNLAADLGILDTDVHLGRSTFRLGNSCLAFTNAKPSIDICLCISALPLFIKANANVAAIVDIAGENAVTALLTALVS
jgi:hypothetical protein